MTEISITNPSISNTETSDVTKLTQNDNDLVNGLTDGTKDIDVSAITAAGLITANGGLATGSSGDDIYSVVWTDYSASTTLTGFSSTTVKYIAYKKVGKVVFVLYSIKGTSNAITFSFTLPYTSSNLSASNDLYALGVGQDNSAVTATPVMLVLGNNSSTADLYKDATAATWTASGTKEANGQFWYEATT